MTQSPKKRGTTENIAKELHSSARYEEICCTEEYIYKLYMGKDHLQMMRCDHRGSEMTFERVKNSNDIKEIDSSGEDWVIPSGQLNEYIIQEKCNGIRYYRIIKRDKVRKIENNMVDADPKDWMYYIERSKKGK